MGCAMASDHPFWAHGLRAVQAARAGQRSFAGLLVHWGRASGLDTGVELAGHAKPPHR